MVIKRLKMRISDAFVERPVISKIIVLFIVIALFVVIINSEDAKELFFV